MTKPIVIAVDAMGGDNSPYKIVKGISEYIKPSRIAHSKYWWLVNMRLRYLSKKPHWVQKSRLLYPRTW